MKKYGVYPIILFLLLTHSCTWIENETIIANNFDTTVNNLDATIYIIDINTQVLGRIIPPELFGVNVEWINKANGLVDNNGEIDTLLSSALVTGGVSNIRYPGGTFSDYYIWTDGIGSPDSRPIMPHSTDPGSEVNLFGTAEYLALCKSGGIQPFITVNAGTGDPELAAEWVSYANDPYDSRRISDGVDSAARVNFWEIGNELYYPDNPGEPKLDMFTPESYSEKAAKIISAMRAKDDTIKIFAIGTMNPYGVPKPNPQWTEIVLDNLATKNNLIDGIAVHQAYFPITFGNQQTSQRDGYTLMWASPERVAQSLESLAVLLDSAENERKLRIAVTEWGTLFPFDKKEWFDHHKTMGSAIYISRMFQVFMEARRLDFAHFFKFSDILLGMGFFDYRKDFKLSWLAFQLYQRQADTQIVSSSVINSPLFHVPKSIILGEELNPPVLTSIASQSLDGNRMYVNVINRSWDTIHKVSVELDDFEAESCILYEISTQSVTDNNGSDIIPYIKDSNPNLYQDPEVSLGFKGLRDIKTKSIPINSVIEIPPFSVITLEYQR